MKSTHKTIMYACTSRKTGNKSIHIICMRVCITYIRRYTHEKQSQKHLGVVEFDSQVVYFGLKAFNGLDIMYVMAMNL